MSESDQTPASGGLIDRLKGTAKQVAGTVTGNEDLKHEGQLHHDKVDAAATAAALQQTAEREESAADVTAREHEVEIERARLAAQTAAESREAALEDEQAAEQRRIAEQTAQGIEGAERQKAVQQDTAARAESHAAAEHAAADQQAARLEAQAEAAKQTAETLHTVTEETA